MSYARKKALGVRLALLAEAPGTNVGGKLNDPWPVLKTKLDKAFSELVRRTYAGDNGYVRCIDCGEVMYWKDSDCGHFADRDNLPTRWDIENCRPQKKSCNRFKKGRIYEFGRALNRESPGLADRLILRSKASPEKIRDQAPALLLEIRRLLKIQRKRFK